MLDQYRSLRPAWFGAVSGAANRLFGILALIEFAWAAAVLAMERSDLQGWTAGLIRRMMFVGAFYALLVNGPVWIPAIIDSLASVGRSAAGLVGGLSPGDVFLRGLDIASSLASAASSTGFLSNPAGAFALVLAAMLTFLAFVMVSVHFIMAMVESYIVIGAGFLFLGFGGSRWTAPYVERYIALAVAVGVKILVLYLLIGGGSTLSAAWAARAGGIGSAANPLVESLDIVGGSVVFMAVCWQIPKFTASLLGGSPAFSGGDIAAVGIAAAQAAFVVGSLGAAAAKMLAVRAAGSTVTSVSEAAGMGARSQSNAGPKQSAGARNDSPATGGSAGMVGSNGNSQPPPPTVPTAGQGETRRSGPEGASPGSQVSPPSK